MIDDVLHMRNVEQPLANGSICTIIEWRVDKSCPGRCYSWFPDACPLNLAIALRNQGSDPDSRGLVSLGS